MVGLVAGLVVSAPLISAAVGAMVGALAPSPPWPRLESATTLSGSEAADEARDVRHFRLRQGDMDVIFTRYAAWTERC